MGKRRDARILAVQFLYQMESGKPEDTLAALSLFWDLTEAEESMKTFARPRIDGVLRHRRELDERIQKASQNWDLSRMALVDRCVLRLALWEMLHENAVPAAVAINEAVEISKTLSTEESGRFVNGILDR
ncbi:MAG: transcription antitermination factor NusB, partial [Candidatus Methylacidiphilales bacterium]